MYTDITQDTLNTIRMITIHQFNSMTPDTIMATGVNTVPEFDRGEVRWVAVKGAADDWALYYNSSRHTPEYVRMNGIKASSYIVIQRLVQCDNDVMEKYRK
jgi:hypothetical protein